MVIAGGYMSGVRCYTIIFRLFRLIDLLLKWRILVRLVESVLRLSCTRMEGRRLLVLGWLRIRITRLIWLLRLLGLSLAYLRDVWCMS